MLSSDERAEGRSEANAAESPAQEGKARRIQTGNALLGAELRPADARRTGVRRVTPGAVARAAGRGLRWRLVARATGDGRRARATVAPEALPADDVLASAGADGVLVLETDLLGGWGCGRRGRPGPEGSGAPALA